MKLQYYGACVATPHSCTYAFVELKQCRVSFMLLSLACLRSIFLQEHSWLQRVCRDVQRTGQQLYAEQDPSYCPVDVLVYELEELAYQLHVACHEPLQGQSDSHIYTTRPLCSC